MKAFVFTPASGIVSIGYPVGPKNPGESEDDWIARIAAQDVPVTLLAAAGQYLAGAELPKRDAETLGAVYIQLPYRIVLQANIPTDRTYRNAWEVSGELVRHNMHKARALHRDKIRSARVSAFTQLDGQWMRASGTGDSVATAAIEAKRQTWRDAPADPRIDAAVDVAALKAIPFPVT